MAVAHGHAIAEPAAAARRPAPVPAPAREAPALEAEAPTTRDRMEAAFAETAEWTTRERIARRARADDEPEPRAPEAEPEETEAEPEPARPRLRLVDPVDDAVEAAPPAQAVEPIARGPPRLAVVQTKLAVSTPGDALEREADAVAARVQRGDSVRAGPPRGAVPIRGPPAATGDLPRSVASVVAAPGGGSPLDASVRERIEPHLGVDLAHVRVRRGPDAAAAADDLHARAFTSGSTIFLAAGSSPTDLGLMAHEATHVAQQRTVAAARTTLMRDATDVLPDISVDDVIPDWILDGVREAVRAIPGYIVLTYIAGRDPLSDEPAPASPQEVIEAILTRGPFGAAVGGVLQAIDVLGDVFQFVMDGLAANDLTLARIQRDIESAWAELSVTNGIAGNVAIVQRYVDALVNDVTAFADSIVERVLEIVRAVVADVVEPLLQTDAIAPLWNLVRKVLRYDPLRGVPVEAPTAEIIADFLRLIGEDERLAQMEERGTLQSTADWLDTQLATFAGLATELGTLFEDARQAIQPQNLPDLLTNLEALSWRAFGFIQGVGLFAGTVILKVLELIKESLLGWLSDTAHTLPGFHLLTVIIGRNPFTGEEVPLTAETLIRGFITLLPGGAATYEQLAESGVISSAAQRIEGEMTRLGITLELITGTFLGIWDSLTLDDLLAPLDAFARILAQFGEPLARIVEFAAVVIEVVVTLILRLMNFPTELLGSVISNTLAAIDDIRRDPVGFLLNMVEAIKLGFTAFFDNFARYLVDGLVAWLFRGLGQLGITLPTDFTLASILTFVFQVLGLTVEHLWEKLGEHIGPERVQMIRDALDMLSGVWQFIVDVQREGLPAIWRYVQDQLSSIWTTLLSMATEWIIQSIVVNATIKLLSFIDPSGIMATINTCVAIFNAIVSAIEYMRDMLEVFNQYVATLAAVAAGNIVPGAQMLETGLAAIIPIAIGFLAKQVGIGNIPDKIAELIGSLRELIDQAIDWLIEQALRLGQAALDALSRLVSGGAEEHLEEPAEELETGDVEHDAAVTAGLTALEQAEDLYLVNGEISQEDAVTVAATVKAEHPVFTVLHVVDGDDSWDYDWAASPGKKKQGGKKKDPQTSAPGLGRIGSHGSKPSSLRKGIRLHWLESEHIIPFATGKRLFQMVNLAVPGRGTHEDRAQTTIMIYYGAARIKTPLDNQLSGDFEAALAAANIQDRMTSARKGAEAGSEGSREGIGHLLAGITALFKAARDDAVKRTNEDAIPGENQTVMEGTTLTNGQRRGPPGAPEPPLPAPADVEATADTQYDDVMDLVTEALESLTD